MLAMCHTGPAWSALHASRRARWRGTVSQWNASRAFLCGTTGVCVCWCRNVLLLGADLELCWSWHATPRVPCGVTGPPGKASTSPSCMERTCHLSQLRVIISVVCWDEWHRLDIQDDPTIQASSPSSIHPWHHRLLDKTSLPLLLVCPLLQPTGDVVSR